MTPENVLEADEGMEGVMNGGMDNIYKSTFFKKKRKEKAKSFFFFLTRQRAIYKNLCSVKPTSHRTCAKPFKHERK